MRHIAISRVSLASQLSLRPSTALIVRGMMNDSRPAKRVKLDDGTTDPASLRARRAAFLDSLSRSVSPPRGQPVNTNIPDTQRDPSIKNLPQQRATSQHSNGDKPLSTPIPNTVLVESRKNRTKFTSRPVAKLISSPFQLSKIRDLPSSENVDTLSLHDILGDPLIKEAWIFNFCFDVDWLMGHFDPDVRDIVDVRIVHGSWRREDVNKFGIDDACSRRLNVRAIQAYLPDAFGTHHSKMFVLFRHDDTAQIVIHTANMLSKDWSNMTQAIWKSPLLPLLQSKQDKQEDGSVIGSSFKSDLLRYLGAYGSKLKALVKQLQTYSFDNIKAVLVASVPSKFKVSAPDNEVWGHEMLRRKLADVTQQAVGRQDPHHVVFQVSSIATIAAGWLEGTLYAACSSSRQSTSIIFPTAPDVAMSLDGYSAGGSIHTKAQSANHLKQIANLKPQLSRWTEGRLLTSRAGRDLAAPHIKTYVCFASEPNQNNPVPNIDWALVTSANLSTQAWGSAPKLAKGQKNQEEAMVHIQSYEIGVLVWPGLFADKMEQTGYGQDSQVIMVPCFKKDMPDARGSTASKIVGFRMPYDLPLTRYEEDELPWSPQSTYQEPDRHGRLWQ